MTGNSLHPDWLELSPEEEEAERERRTIGSPYIFDESRILKNATFVSCKLNQDTFAFGLFLPREVHVRDRDGGVIGNDQVWSPVLIDSNHELHEPTREFEIEERIKFKSIPSNIELRWGLSSIQDYLEEKTPKINPKVLFQKIKNQYQKFMFFRDDSWYDVHALWDIGTYLFMLFSVFPIFEMRGIAGTAKTKCMKVSRMMAFNPTDIMINPSEATLFRETHDKRPTKYIDEAERLFRYNRNTSSIESDSRVELINGSYAKGSTVPRVEKINNKFVTIYYDCYSPTQISSIRGLFGATESRAITHIMTKALDNDKRGEMEVEDYENDYIWKEIRDDLYVFVLQNWKIIEDAYLNFKDDVKIKKRDLQLWKPIFVLAKIIDIGLFDKLKEFATRTSRQRRQDSIPEGTLDYNLLCVMKQLIESGKTKVYVEEIKEVYKESYDAEIRRGFNKTLSTRLDNLGFKELRDKDRNGSFFDVPREIFNTIISPICPDLSSQSPQSSPYVTQYIEKDKSDCDEKMMENNEPVGKQCDECDANDDCDSDIEEKFLNYFKEKHPNYDGKDGFKVDSLASKFGLTIEQVENVIRNIQKIGMIFEVHPAIWRLNR